MLYSIDSWIENIKLMFAVKLYSCSFRGSIYRATTESTCSGVLVLQLELTDALYVYYGIFESSLKYSTFTDSFQRLSVLWAEILL